MIRLIKSNRKSTRFERLLWFGVALISLPPLLAVLSGNPADLFTDYRMAFFAFFAGIAAIGLSMNWGPVIPGSIWGIAILMIVTDPISSSNEEAIFKALGVPLIGAVLGAVFGIMVDRDLSHPPTTRHDPGEMASDESNRNITS
jgi:hypothetical protein